MVAQRTRDGAEYCLDRTPGILLRQACLGGDGGDQLPTVQTPTPLTEKGWTRTGHANPSSPEWSGFPATRSLRLPMSRPPGGVASHRVANGCAGEGALGLPEVGRPRQTHGMRLLRARYCGRPDGAQHRGRPLETGRRTTRIGLLRACRRGTAAADAHPHTRHRNRTAGMERRPRTLSGAVSSVATPCRRRRSNGTPAVARRGTFAPPPTCPCRPYRPCRRRHQMPASPSRGCRRPTTR